MDRECRIIRLFEFPHIYAHTYVCLRINTYEYSNLKKRHTSRYGLFLHKGFTAIIYTYICKRFVACESSPPRLILFTISSTSLIFSRDDTLLTLNLTYFTHLLQ